MGTENLSIKDNLMEILDYSGYFPEPKRIRPIAFHSALKTIYLLLCTYHDDEPEMKPYLDWLSTQTSNFL